MPRRFSLLAFLMSLGAVAGTSAATADPIDFNRDIRPILSDNCFTCHGQDAGTREADLRLDTRDSLFADRPSGAPITPGKPDESELISRLETNDASLKMPPPKTGKTLSPAQVDLLKRWIAQGAEWKGHWAYQVPTRPAVPAVPESASNAARAFVRGDIDRFLLARMQSVGFSPAPEADRRTLVRRAFFDLTGLPPTPEDVAAAEGDTRPDWFERVVDRLLHSPQYGERMAVYWLDLVRYADSAGYHSDNPINVQPYRDHVIQVFNTNQPFDQFTIEQLAGDLLPNATISQRVASGYNRLLQTTEEGGSQPAEYEAKYAADRVRNVSTVWMAATMGCCQCHDHKYDPLTTRDFYSMAAFFADVQEAAVGRREPGMPVPNEAQSAELARLNAAIETANTALQVAAENRLSAWKSGSADEFKGVAWRQPSAVTATSSEQGVQLTQRSDGAWVASGHGPATDVYDVKFAPGEDTFTGLRLEVLTDESLAANASRGPGRASNGNFVITEFKLHRIGPNGEMQPVALKGTRTDFNQDGFSGDATLDGKDDTGWAVVPQTGSGHEIVLNLAEPIVDASGSSFVLQIEQKFTISTHHTLGCFRVSTTATPQPAGKLVPVDIAAIAAKPVDSINDAERGKLIGFLREKSPALDAERNAVSAAVQARDSYAQSLPMSLVSMSGAPRTVRILPRGNWLDSSGEVVMPKTPQSLFSLPEREGRATRLDLANWLVSPQNPLTSRAQANRFWKLFFGAGLARTLDDFGLQGEWPTHPDLLDWLAVEFQESGWNVKHMVRLIVTSGAYRQSSQETPLQRERDPLNRYWARQGRFRLEAEFVRDNCLAISGLLVPEIGGPSVKPYQPAGYWAALNFPVREWQNDKGAGLYRRGMYTHWQRSFPHPSLLAFDAPSREESVCERTRSNIPQQALAMLNDPTYVEAARMFAARTLKHDADEDRSRLAWAFLQATQRSPNNDELDVLSELLAKHRTEYASEATASSQLLSVGDSVAPADVAATELAAWTSVARTLLNLHETMTRD